MSDTPKRDDEFRDPTAPSEPERPDTTPGVTWSDDSTQQLGSRDTQQLPNTPPGAAVPPETPGRSAAGSGTPPPPPPGTPPPPGPVPPTTSTPGQPYGAPPAGSPGYGAGGPAYSPYAQQPPQNPYARPAGGPPPPPYAGGPAPQGGYPYGPGSYVQQRPSNGSALALTIVSGLSLVLGACLTAIPALILGILALVKHGDSPAEAARYARWGWIAYAVGVLIYIAAVIGIIALVVTTSDPMMRY